MGLTFVVIIIIAIILLVIAFKILKSILKAILIIGIIISFQSCERKNSDQKTLNYAVVTSDIDNFWTA